MQSSRLILRKLTGGCRNVIATDTAKCTESSNSGSGILNRQVFIRLFHKTGVSSSKSPASPGTSKEPSKDGTTKRAKTPIGKLDELEEGKHPYQEKEPLPAWPDNTNPHTGEVGGPRGPEPTRYGDWERKGRVTDF